MHANAIEVFDQSQLAFMLPALADLNTIMLPETQQHNCLVCQPQQRNTSGRVFGGFLMRRAFELAYATAYCFSGTNPAFLEVDEVLFVAPVSIGNLLSYESSVLYTEIRDGQPLMHIEVLRFSLASLSLSLLLLLFLLLLLSFSLSLFLSQNDIFGPHSEREYNEWCDADPPPPSASAHFHPPFSCRRGGGPGHGAGGENQQHLQRLPLHVCQQRGQRPGVGVLARNKHNFSDAGAVCAADPARCLALVVWRLFAGIQGTLHRKIMPKTIEQAYRIVARQHVEKEGR